MHTVGSITAPHAQTVGKMSRVIDHSKDIRIIAQTIIFIIIVLIYCIIVSMIVHSKECHYLIVGVGLEWEWGW